MATVKESVDGPICEACEEREADVTCWSYVLDEKFEYCPTCAPEKISEYPDLVVIDQ